MSYSACASSALIHPEGYAPGAIGSIYEAAINTNPVASGALLQPIAAITLPKGRWILAGIVTLDAASAGQTLVGNLAIAKDAVVFWRIQNVSVLDSISITLSAIVDSDGTAVVTIPCNYATSGGAAYSALASPLSRVQFIRVA